MHLERLFSCLKTFIKKDCVFSSAKTYQRRQFNVSFRRFIGFLESVGRFAQKKITISAFFHLYGWKRIISPPFPPPSGGNGVAIERFA
jgi:hypothetical protein